jgi:hypothetical protein
MNFIHAVKAPPRLVYGALGARLPALPLAVRPRRARHGTAV